MDDVADAERTGVSILADEPLLKADQVEVVEAGSDDGLGTLQLEVADAADVLVLGQLRLAGGGQGGGEFPYASSPRAVGGNMPREETSVVE